MQTNPGQFQNIYTKHNTADTMSAADRRPTDGASGGRKACGVQGRSQSNAPAARRVGENKYIEVGKNVRGLNSYQKSLKF